jgi:predicted Zn-ribbon and HTH transcriptional regulator
MHGRQNRPKEPAVPSERHDTVRQEILSLLDGQTMSARDISGYVRVSEKDVYDHLEHIERSLHRTGHQLSVTPAECHKCGFTFRKRDRLRKPGRCPVCRSESISEPLFAIKH